MNYNNQIPVPCEEQLGMKEYMPKNSEVLREYEVRIQFLNRGCVIHVGCKSIAFEDVQLAMNELNKYVSNPYEEQQAWRKLLDS
jgi:hypothetical protein